MNIFSMLESLYPSFTKAEKKIADCLLMDKDQSFSPNVTLDKMAKSFGVGQASIIRLAKKCGYGSYREFLIDLVHSQHAFYLSRRQTDSLHDDLVSLLDQCQETFSKEDLRLVVQCIYRADIVVCVGYGISAHVANLASLRMRHENILAIPNVPGEFIFYSENAYTGKNRSLRTVVLTFSASGETPETLHCVQEYASSGACIVALTGYVESTLAKCSNIVLYAPSNAPKGSHRRNLDGIFSQLFIVEAIIEEYLTMINKTEMEET